MTKSFYILVVLLLMACSVKQQSLPNNNGGKDTLSVGSTYKLGGKLKGFSVSANDYTEEISIIKNGKRLETIKYPDYNPMRDFFFEGIEQTPEGFDMIIQYGHSRFRIEKKLIFKYSSNKFYLTNSIETFTEIFDFETDSAYVTTTEVELEKPIPFNKVNLEEITEPDSKFWNEQQ